MDKMQLKVRRTTWEGFFYCPIDVTGEQIVGDSFGNSVSSTQPYPFHFESIDKVLGLARLGRSPALSPHPTPIFLLSFHIFSFEMKLDTAPCEHPAFFLPDSLVCSHPQRVSTIVPGGNWLGGESCRSK